MKLCPSIILDELYAAFAKEPRPTTIATCPCCVDEEEAAKLIATPLRQITPVDLGKYASSVFLTVGSERDFRYFLPRILEVLAGDAPWWPDPEVVGRAMANVQWETYTNEQRAVLLAYFDAVFDTLLNAPNPDGYELDAWLCCSSYVLPQWELILERLRSRPNALLKLYEWHSEPLQKGRLGNGFWDNSPKKAVFLQWMMSEQVKAILIAAWGL